MKISFTIFQHFSKNNQHFWAFWSPFPPSLLISTLFWTIIHVKLYYTFTAILNDYYCLILLKYINLNWTKFISILNYILVEIFKYCPPLFRFAPRSKTLATALLPALVICIDCTTKAVLFENTQLSCTIDSALSSPKLSSGEMLMHSIRWTSH